MSKPKGKPKGIIAKCIYCNTTTEMSDEHYLSECLGKFENFESLSDRICASCNNICGKLEDQFCHTGEVGFLRYALGVQGKKKHKKKKVIAEEN